MESTRALMQSILDYASLFPPALWDMPKTVATYKLRIMEKLGVTSTPELVARYRSLGLPGT